MSSKRPEPTGSDRSQSWTERALLMLEHIHLTVPLTDEYYETLGDFLAAPITQRIRGNHVRHVPYVSPECHPERRGTLTPDG